MDGWANTDLKVGAIVALSPARDAATKAEFNAQILGFVATGLVIVGYTPQIVHLTRASCAHFTGTRIPPAVAVTSRIAVALHSRSIRIASAALERSRPSAPGARCDAAAC